MFRAGFHEYQTNKIPKASILLLKNANISTSGFIVRNVELKQYIESTDCHLGEYSLITVVIDTDKGCIEMKYDEGYKGDGALDDWAKFLSHYVGYTSLITRALLELQALMT